VYSSFHRRRTIETNNLRVICIGNEFFYPDNFGILIYYKLKSLNLNIELINGGVGGLSLAPYFETDKKILIIDYAVNMPKLLTNKDIQKLELSSFSYDKAFLYLLKNIKKEFLIYTCSEKFNPDNLDKYIQEILKVIDGYF